MLIALLITWYLIGYFHSYVAIRKIIHNHRGNTWILMEKITAISISIFSWIAIVGLIIIIVTDIDLDKKCKW